MFQSNHSKLCLKDKPLLCDTHTRNKFEECACGFALAQTAPRKHHRAHSKAAQQVSTSSPLKALSTCRIKLGVSDNLHSQHDYININDRS